MYVPRIATGDGSIVLDLDGRSVRAGLAASPTVEAAVRGATHEGVSAQSIKAPMPGTVIAVRVNEGEAVEAGQVLVVLEAMKMQNTVPAPAAGRVAKLMVEAGRQVQRGDTLVELDVGRRPDRRNVSSMAQLPGHVRILRSWPARRPSERVPTYFDRGQGGIHTTSCGCWFDGDRSDQLCLA